MAINRAAILQQVLQQLQLGLATSAEVSMLRLPASPSTTPQVVIKLAGETIAAHESEHPTFGRKLQLAIETTVAPATELALMQTLDALSESIELALQDKEQASLWMTITPQKTDFAFDPQPEGLAATMVQSFELSYLVLREETCTAPVITEVYLSNQGDAHELVATNTTN